MSSLIGNKLKIGLFGESHGSHIGAIAYGFPSGFEISKDELNKFLSRRKTGQNKFTTQRKETDDYEIVSGYYNNRTTGTPFAVIIKNNDVNSKDYEQLKYKMRPSHADYTGHIKYRGFEDNRGGGHFSGRITAPLCVIGGIALQILKSKGIEIYAHIKSLYDIEDLPIEKVSIEEQKKVCEKTLAFFDNEKLEEAKILLENIKKEKNSVGGIIELAVHGVKAGIGDPIFDSVESRLSSMIFGIPGVKGLEFGCGFGCAKMKGSLHNDPFEIKDSKIVTTTNNSGGINGGITNGMPIILRAAVKPTASIGLMQDTVDIKEMKNTKLKITGRHDPAIAVRIVPVLEAVVAISMLDMILENTDI